MDFQKELKKRKLKITPQRIAILQEIADKGHITIEDVYDKVKKNYPSVSFATIYKNIGILCESNILSIVKTPGFKQRYELNCGKHIHVFCEKCKKLEDLHIDYSSLERDCAKNTGYIFNKLSAVFVGICPSCGRG